jgi:hypothetical protein
MAAAVAVVETAGSANGCLTDGGRAMAETAEVRMVSGIEDKYGGVSKWCLAWRWQRTTGLATGV